MDGSPAPRYLWKSLFRMQVLKLLEVAHGSSRVGVERLADSPESGNGHWIHPSVTTTDRSLHTRGVGRWRGGGICAGGGRVPDPPLTSSRPVDPRMWRAEWLGVERLADPRERGSEHRIHPSRHRHLRILVHWRGWEVERWQDLCRRGKGAGSAPHIASASGPTRVGGGEATWSSMPEGEVAPDRLESEFVDNLCPPAWPFPNLAYEIQARTPKLASQINLELLTIFTFCSALPSNLAHLSLLAMSTSCKGPSTSSPTEFEHVAPLPSNAKTVLRMRANEGECKGWWHPNAGGQERWQVVWCGTLDRGVRRGRFEIPTTSLLSKDWILFGIS